MAYILFYRKTEISESFISHSRLGHFFYKGWGFDCLYDTLFVIPYKWLSEINKKDFIDKFFTYIAQGTSFFNTILSRTQNGSLRWYVMVLTVGIVVILTIMLNL